MQSKTNSLKEALTNVAIGFVVALASQLVIFPAHGIIVELETNLSIGAWFTGVAVIRSYVVRRVYNRYTDAK